ncbi:glycosyltransferase family 1 protein [Hyaloscypha variabilis F]|uniref:Glycosyltransferase family 1 protein n=1 Tax=Hyaloscypha variabilis (strain UAMH 11265 / GT02V1 / F) TaxID=1149755 RepID=A0A2J6QU36_HYAVF|nr:glycosyltransferase family 1 protein [Hyaloscypha variabilis F]
MALDQTPFIVIGSHPVYGHVQPLRLIASHLVNLGYEVTFLAPNAYRESIEKTGATFHALTGNADYTEKDFEKNWPEMHFWPPGIDQMAYRGIAPARAMFRQSRGVQEVLRAFKARDPNRPVVIVHEAWFRGVVPMLLGAPNMLKAPVLAIGVLPFMGSSKDLIPYGPKQGPITSPEGREKAKAIHEFIKNATWRPKREFKWVLEDLNVPEDAEIPELMDLDRLPDRFLQMCIPSLEFPRSDLSPNFRFAGSLPSMVPDSWTDKPHWWNAVVSNLGQKDVVAVSQGTLDINYNELIVPAVQGLRDRPNTIVIVVLGIKGATLPAGTDIPENCYVGDYVPYTELFKYASVFVTNGGYGGVNFAVTRGIPIIIGGVIGDKPLTSARTPAPEQVRYAVDLLQSNPKYKKRALEMQEEAKKFDPLSIIVEEINALAKGKQR